MDPAQLAYQEFMLGSKNKSSTTPSATPRTKNTPGSSTKKTFSKRYGPIVKAFQGRLQEWKDSDDQLFQVLNSIVNLRNRIWWESKGLASLKNQDKPWSGHRATRNQRNFLTGSDMELALEHDLLQHERMLAYTRSLVSAMGSSLDAMGRRLEEFYHQPDIPPEILEKTLTVYHFLGEELYRKQLLVNQVLDSCHNGMLGVDKNDDCAVSNPRSIAQQVYAKWKGDKKSDEYLVTKEYLSRKV
jgi:hypothetical protein